jgi:hypothetical protein
MSKYYLCEFHEQNGDFEYTHHHVYSDEFLNNNKIKITNEIIVMTLNYLIIFSETLAKMIRTEKAIGHTKD